MYNYVNRTFYQQRFAAEIKTTPISDLLIEKCYDAQENIDDLCKETIKKNSVLSVINNTISYIFEMGAVYFYLGKKVISNVISIASFSSVLDAANQFSNNFVDMAKFINDLKNKYNEKIFKVSLNAGFTCPNRDGKLGYGGYMLPQYDNVPAGDYYSRITNVERITSKGKPGISVCYKMMKFQDAYQKVNNIYKSNQDPKIYKIKQIYPFDSQAYDRFLEAMYEALELDYKEDIALEDIIGITEVIGISYSKHSDIGGISTRRPWDEESFVYLYNKNNAPNPPIDNYYDVEYDEYGNVI